VIVWARAIMLGAVLLGAGAAGSQGTPADAVLGARVDVTDAWVRATVPGQPATAAYLQIKSDVDLRLVQVTTPAAQRCEVHETTLVNDVMRMRAVPELRIKANVPTVFEQLHRHLMLQGLARPLRAGEKVVLTLTFVDDRAASHTVTVAAPVRADN
jgi:periplasmic copper chaperone A